MLEIIMSLSNWLAVNPWRMVGFLAFVAIFSVIFALGAVLSEDSRW